MLASQEKIGLTTAHGALEKYLPTLRSDTVSCSHQARHWERCRNVPSLSSKHAGLAKLADIGPHNLPHCFGYRMAELVPLYRLAQMMGRDSLDTNRLFV